MSSLFLGYAWGQKSKPWHLRLQHRRETSAGSGRYHTLSRMETWDPVRTAIIVCDMWDAHHSINAVRRVEELAPRIDLVLRRARDSGATIIHAPSDCMAAYVDHPARKRAMNSPASSQVPRHMNAWCNRIEAEKNFAYPIDQSDGGEDDDLEEHAAWAKELESRGRDPGQPWTCQSPLINIDPSADFITDQGNEVWNILQARQIENVILCGVHTNMCVLGRPFGLRNLVTAGKRVVLARDLTDTMYNPRSWPFVSHHTGTDLIVEYIEKCICPTITSDQLAEGPPFRFKTDLRPRIVIVMAEDEYETNRTLPKFAADHLGKNYQVALVFGSDDNPNDLPGLDLLDTADAAIISVRRRPLPAEQLEKIRRFVDNGKPMIGLRTASHAFSLRGNDPAPGLETWPEFDRDVWGGNYTGHHGTDQLPSVVRHSDNSHHSILQGVAEQPFQAGGSLYRTSPLAPKTNLLLLGRIPGIPPEPIAWTFERANGGRSFYTSLGHKDDFSNPDFVRLLGNSLAWATGIDPGNLTDPSSSATTETSSWRAIDLPERGSGTNLDSSAAGEGQAWFRCYLKVTQADAHSVFRLRVPSLPGLAIWVNGKSLTWQPTADAVVVPQIPTEFIDFNELNLLVIRCNQGASGPALLEAPTLYIDTVEHKLAGRWQKRIGADSSFSALRLPPKFGAAPDVLFDFANPPVRPSANVASLKVADDLELDLLLQEPLVANPLYLNFDERGRLWVVQYRQYPWPAGLKLVSRDNVWRNVYQPPFPPPPPHEEGSPFRGQDRITIHEDTDGDGNFDHHKIFIDGLNLATAALKGRNGVFVMNPPYLLFYSDQDNDDVPDSLKPQILLSGFGIEDTHSIANSLRWGPDGWIYGAQGSTVSAAIVRHGQDGEPIPGEKPVHSMGQHVWRYHPEQRTYEIFAEGGGNAFGIEFDAAGRVYSGHNGGDTRGFHYVPGGYYLKNFGKHGAHSNPFTFAFSGAMKHHAVERFTHTFEIYEADSLPQRYRGKLFAVSPILHYVIVSDIFEDGSTRMTRDVGPVLMPGTSERDNWFTPVDIQTGPDGSLYLADWYSVQTNHYHNHEGQTNPDLGRVYRLRATATSNFPVFNLGLCTSEQLVHDYLQHPNRWYRETALRLLGDRRDRTVIPMLREMATKSDSAHALDAAWALHLCGGWDDPVACTLLQHANPDVRAWTIRLLGDNGNVSELLADAMISIAGRESNAEVRLQLACSCRKLPTALGLAILRQLLLHSNDEHDPLIPSAIWWGLESQADHHSEVLQWIREEKLWQAPLSQSAHIMEYLMRRYASLGSQEDLLMCAAIFKQSPDAQQTGHLLNGFLRAFEGRTIPPLPSELVVELSRVEGRFALVLGIRRGDKEAIRRSLEKIQDVTVTESDRVQFIRAIGEVQADAATCVPVLLRVLQGSPAENIALNCLIALQNYRDLEIGSVIVSHFNQMPPLVQETAQSVLASRESWSDQLLAAIENNAITKGVINQDTIVRLRLHQTPSIHERTVNLFPAEVVDDAQLNITISLLEGVVFSGKGDPMKGQEIYHGIGTCGKCHQMFGRGGMVGPDLTSYNRSDFRAMLLAIIHPSAEIREGFENWTVLTDDGQVITGIKVDEDDERLVVRTADGQSVTLVKKQIDELHQNKISLMPTGLLNVLSEAEIRDLFAFLTSTTPPL